jgi:phospholipid/cholesterol/gamma-HCH transport system substrate-binding protein
MDTDSLVKSVNNVLDKETRTNLKDAINNFTIMASELKTASRSINGLLTENKGKLDNTFTNLDEMSSNFAKLSDTLSRVEIGALVSNFENLVKDFEGIANNLKSGQGTVGKLLQDDQVYVNLERTTKQMELLLQDLRLNPKRYVHLSVFGKKAKEYNPPKDSLR